MSTVRHALPELADAAAPGPPLFTLEQLAGLRLSVEVALGSSGTLVDDLVRLRPGTILRLDRLTGEPLQILANGTPIASGEIRVQGERFAIRITRIHHAPPRDSSPVPEVPRADRSTA